MSAKHTPAFERVRDALLALADDGRKRLADLFGSLTEKKADPSASLLSFIAASAALDRDDQAKLARWVRTYVNRWWQVPQAPSRLHPSEKKPS